MYIILKQKNWNPNYILQIYMNNNNEIGYIYCKPTILINVKTTLHATKQAALICAIQKKCNVNTEMVHIT